MHEKNLCVCNLRTLPDQVFSECILLNQNSEQWTRGFQLYVNLFHTMKHKKNIKIVFYACKSILASSKMT